MFFRSTLRRTESICCKFLSWFPLGLVAFLTTWALYVQAYTICLRYVGGKTGYAWAALTVMLYAMALWCYYTACLTPPGSPSSPIPKPSQDASYSLLPTTSTTSHERDVELGAPTSTITVKENGKARYCTKCQCPKPDRAHHCSVCGVCVLKMDHHCPWLSTCVGWNNYKPFVLFLVYVTLFATSCFAGTCLAIYWWTLEPYSGVEDEFLQLSWVLLAALSGCITIIVGAFGGWHISLCLRNITTIESLESTRYSTPHPLSRLRRSAPTNIEIGNAFDLGYYANWCQVFGERKALWWLPFDGGRRGDGRVFEVSGQARQRLEEVAMRVRSEEERHLGRWESEWADVEDYDMA